MSRMATMCAGVLLFGAAPALAQAPERQLLLVSADAPFAHANSGLTLPATLIGLPRTRVREWEAPQLDISATYLSTDADEELTIYVYRTTAGAVPLWFDRTRLAIETREGWGTPTVVVAPTAIAPPGRAVASGLIAAWSFAGGPYRGSAFILLPLGEWLAKLRYSSKSIDGVAAAAKIRAALAALEWPQAAADGTVAVPVADCPAPLAFKGDAKTAKIDGATAMFGAVLAGLPRSKMTTADGPPVTWCRDPARFDIGGVYRAEASTTSYMIALSDAGRGVQVAPNAANILQKRGETSWSVDLVLPGRTINYPPQDRMPTPTRVSELLKGNAISSATTWGDKPQIELSPSSFK